MSLSLTLQSPPPKPLLLASLAAIYITYYMHRLRQNILLAKATKLPYVVSPIDFSNSLLILVYRPLLRLFSLLPFFLTQPWIDVISPLTSWDHGHAVYERLGGDTFLIVTSAGITARTCDPKIIHQITQRRNDFVKPVETYKITNIYGRNILSVEGDIWKRHRKVIGPCFNEGINRTVWAESLRQAKGMVDSWVGENSEGTVESLAEDCMRLSLAVISKAGFGKEMTWPTKNSTEKNVGEAEIDERQHSMSFQHALAMLVSSVYFVAILPKTLMRFAPLASLRRGYHSFLEIGKYMLEFKEQAEEDPDEGSRGSSLLKAMVNAAAAAAANGDEAALKQKNSKQFFTQDELFGNAFIMIVAGHETTANTLQYAMINLAMHPKAQTRLQAELDKVFGSRDQSEWSYEDDLQKFLNGLPGAIMAEQLRIQSPVAGIGKLTLTDQTLVVNGNKHVLPSGTLVYLDTTGAHMNPEAWKGADSIDLGSFNPERWLKESANDTETSLYQPESGAFIAFSAGARSCIGKRFAQIEFVAVIAALFRDWSLELNVDGHVSTKKVQNLAEMEEAVWNETRQDIKGILKNKMTIYVTMQLEHGLNIPLKVVKRGRERFNNCA